jgi:hypothetical protein
VTGCPAAILAAAIEAWLQQNASIDGLFMFVLLNSNTVMNCISQHSVLLPNTSAAVL